MKSHPNFKSVYSEVINADDIIDYVSHPLHYQSEFYRSTIPWEKTLWKDKELENFNIDLEMVDRLYYIHYSGKNIEDSFEMVARMDYKGRKVYFELFALCHYTGFGRYGSGTIFVSGDANLFMKLIITNKHPSSLIYKSLREDGIRVEEPTEYDACSRFQKNGAPTLKFLCYLTMHENKNLLEASFLELPKILEESVKNFIRTMEAKETYSYINNPPPKKKFKSLRKTV